MIDRHAPPPGGTNPLHRTVNLEYRFVMEGEMVLELDSGETRLLKRRDLAVQRGTMHAWRNASKDRVGARAVI